MKIHSGKLLVGIVILIVLAATMAEISCSGIRFWRKTVNDTTEQTLRRDLAMMRETIRNFANTKRELPQTLKDLDAYGVYSTIPDPVTGRADWQVTIGEDPKLLKGKRGIINVHSASTAISSDGSPHNTW
jgi:hypothetical protein